MIRRCDGSDDNLTRKISESEFDPARMTLSTWNRPAFNPPGSVVIRCNCGLVFDDVTRTVIYPHDPV